MHVLVHRSLWLLAFLAVALAATIAAAAESDRPNFILFIADDMGAPDSGAYGNRGIRTPRLDRLATEGMRFDRAFLTCSSCSPSRASIITGLYPHQTGAHELHMPLPGDRVTFVELLRAAGYWTVAAGKWHLGPETKPKFDQVIEKQGQWVEALKDRPRDKPFFFWFASTDPHRPYEPNSIPQPHGESDVTVPAYLPDTPEVRGDLALYYDEINRLDGAVGEALDELDRQQAAENTFVLFISDNGQPFPRAKTTVYDSGIQTPWIVRWPARVKPGSVCKSLVSSIDIAPTVCVLAGVSPSPTFEGKNFAPLLANPAATIREYVFAEHNWHDYTAFDRAVRDQRYKYIRSWYTDLPQTPPADAVKSITFQTMLQLGGEGKLLDQLQQCFVLPRPEQELYDTETDPNELFNLASDPSYLATLLRMDTALADWQRKTNDRLPEIRTPDKYDRKTAEPLEPKKKRT
ncbi:MAG TPA: sulfatase [Pirellulales bacterium]|jgi:arylsulfatase A-like enzyme|nr:sulfatase [Pirellulales bacterium]